MEFTGKHVLITGASGGIGSALCQAFAENGATVGLHFNSSRSKAEDTKNSLKGADHQLIQADLAKTGAVQKLIDEFVESYDKIDVLVNNAGLAELHPPDEVSLEQWQNSWHKTLALNLQAAADLCYCAIEKMKSSGGGRIINISSRGAFRGEPEMPAYGASKAALNSLTQSLAKAMAKYLIYVSAVAPSFIETDMAIKTLDAEGRKALLRENPLGRLGQPEEVARAVLFLASPGTEYSTGTIIDVNGASYFR